MAWNPFQFQYNASYLGEEGNDALLEVRKGANVEHIRFPKGLLPSDLEPGSHFNLKVEDTETARSGELQTLRKLLNDLIQ